MRRGPAGGETPGAGDLKLPPALVPHTRGTNAAGAVGEYSLVREGEIVRCPWHGWEFEIATGRSLFNPHKVRTRSFPVEVEPQDPGVETFPVEVEGAKIYVIA